MPTPSQPLRVLVSAGEASGEMYGAELIEQIRRLSPRPVETFGLGGELMQRAGCDVVVEAHDVAVVGLFEVVRHLPGIYRHFHRLVAEAAQRKPDVAVLIDFPEWNLKLAKALHRLGVPVVYYVSPQLWAWRRGRVKLVERFVRKMLVIFPFEREFYAGHGVDVDFVGHPLGRLEPPPISREDFAARYGLDPQKTWITLMPGSRRGEVARHLDTMLEAASRLSHDPQQQFEFLLPVASTLRSSDLGQTLEQGDGLLRESGANVRLVHDARESLKHSRAAVVASGTATVEAAVAGTPFVMVYRLSGLTYNLGRHLVKLPFYAMVNLIAGRQVVPELIQQAFTAESVASALRRLLPEGEPRRLMLAGLAEVQQKLRGTTEQLPSELAAQTVLKVAEGER
ncbi:MAG TPA: lipid-A-disaccharide synthase [candidate division Zixibacteria bacterium]|nr:lipid-A-disaccharide synthase [candidate division Zixibacteria bacterium]